MPKAKIGRLTQYPSELAGNSMARKRYRIWLRQMGLCYCCARNLPFGFATAEHVIPKSKGGKDAEENLVVTCQGCNVWRRDTDLEEFKKNTRRKMRRRRFILPVDFLAQKEKKAPERRRKREQTAAQNEEYKRRKDEGFPLDEGVFRDVDFGKED